MAVKFEAGRLKELPPYLFAQLDRAKEDAVASGVEVIDFGVGDPDLPTPSSIIEKLCQAAGDPANHRYPSYSGTLELRGAVADWYLSRFGVELHAEEEVLILIGSKEGIAHTFWALVDPGDVVLIPDPAYPIYQAQTLLCGGVPHRLPLSKDSDFLPELHSLPSDIAARAKLLVLNYPNNPTGAVAPKAFFQEVVEFARTEGVAVLNDAVYTEISFDGYSPVSLLEAEGAREVAVEFHSLSKTFNMTGWRIGFVSGNREVISSLLRVKQTVDSGVPQAIQYAGIEALTGPQNSVEALRSTYQERRDVLVAGLKRLGWKVEPPRATFYVWAPIPWGGSSLEFAETLVREAGVLVAPGIGFGKHGEGWVRFALTIGRESIEKALPRLGSLSA